MVQADRVDSVASRQVRFARSLKFVDLAVQSLGRFLEMRDFSLFGLQSVGKVMGAVDQGALGIAWAVPGGTVAEHAFDSGEVERPCCIHLRPYKVWRQCRRL